MTTQLQQAIAAAFDAQVVVFFPPGRYLVSDTLWANQTHASGTWNSIGINVCKSRFVPNVLMGSTTSLPQRPTIVLAAAAPGFGDVSMPKNVLKVHNPINENVNMNQIVRGLDFEIGAGNPGAVALYVLGSSQSGAVALYSNPPHFNRSPPFFKMAPKHLDLRYDLLPAPFPVLVEYLWCWGQNTSRIQNINACPHFIFFLFLLQVHARCTGQHGAGRDCGE